jgi:hypothetical protein
MTRFVFPELFHAAAAQIVAGGQPRVGLRWILHSSVGMPRALFKVWHFEGRVPTKEMSVSSQALDAGGRLLSWTIGPAAAVQLTVTVPAGASLALRGFSGAAGTGHCADEETVVGPATNRGIVLFGSPIASVTLTGTGTVSAARIVPIQAFVNEPGWKLVETVGLPATEAFATTGYPMDPQGPVGAERPPVEAAIARVLRGSPDAGWSGVTDRGTGVPGFVLPDPTQLVTKELTPLVAIVGRMLQDVSEPSKHALASYPVTVKAPRSVHGTEASAHWQNKQHASELFPLGSMLIAAGTDAFAALALGFGTTVDLPAQQPAISIATPPVAFNFYMITVEHKVIVKLRLAPGFPPVDVVVAGELATLCMELQPAPALPPAALSAEPGPLDPPRHIDPPGAVDGRWLEAPNVSWAVPVIPADSTPRPTGYAVARGFGAGPMEIRTEARLSGGWTPFIAAEDPDHEPVAVVRYTDDEVPERFPGDTNTVVYSVAATDWFGRWTDWVSADHSRITVPPQVPAVRRVTLDVPASTVSVFPASAAVELTWDWSHRRPREITIRVLVHADGSAPPAVNGSVVSVGGPVVADTVIDFSGASIDSPPSGVLPVADETTGNLRTYRVEIPGLSFAYADHPRVRVTASARATERVGFGLPGAWSPAVSAQAASPIPPPPPFVPAAMTWASIPDPKGVSRITLTWSPSAPRYAVYEADETTVCRELSLPSPNLELASADRLVALRPLPFGQARRAFKRIADNVAAPELRIELPRGSRMIHFYAVVPVSSTGAEGAFPSAGNDYIAVAAPLVQLPEPPALLARDQGGMVALRVDVPETRVRVGRIEIFRAPNRQRAVMPEHAGPPIAVVDAASGTRAGGGIHFEIVDPDPGTAWQSTFYRAVAWAEELPDRGLRGGRSVPSRAVEVVVSSSVAPPLADLTIVDVTGAPDHRLLSFQSDATLALTFRGAHVFAVQIVMPDASIVTRRARADTVPLLTGTLPLPAEQPDSIFRHDAVNPRAGRTYAWVPREAIAVIAEVADPAGRTTRETRQVP